MNVQLLTRCYVNLNRGRVHTLFNEYFYKVLYVVSMINTSYYACNTFKETSQIILNESCLEENQYSKKVANAKSYFSMVDFLLAAKLILCNQFILR